MKNMRLLFTLFLCLLLSSCKPGVNPLSKFKKSQNTVFEEKYVELNLTSGVTVKGRLNSESEDYYFLEFKGKEVRFKKANVESMTDVVTAQPVGAVQAGEVVSNSAVEAPKSQAKPKRKKKKVHTGPVEIELYLKSGDIISGILEQKTATEYLINYEGGLISFAHDEIDKVVRSDEEPEAEEEVFAVASVGGEAVAPQEKGVQTGKAVIYMNYGATISGIIKDKKGSKYTIEWEGDTIELLENEIDKIEYADQKDVAQVVPEGSHNVTVHLPDGSSYSGLLIEQRADVYVIEWKGQRVEFAAQDIVDVDDYGIALPDSMVVVYLINGGAISGEIVSETESHVTIDWNGTKTTFTHAEIERIERAKMLDSRDGTIAPEAEESNAEWSYKNDVVVRLLNSEIFDVDISAITDEVIVFRETFEEGGYVEQEIPLEKLDYLMFKPIENERSEKIRNSLQQLFPDMRFYNDGNTTIITDSYITAVKNYKRVIRHAQTAIYCKFFHAFKDTEQEVQNFVIVFDSGEKWIEYTLADGVPGWIVPGYFNPTEKVLCLYNWLGDEVQDFVTSIMKDGYGRNIDMSATTIKSRVDKKHHMKIDEQAKSLKDLIWSYFDWQMNRLKRITTSVLQHEFAHGMFSNWGLQMVVVSKFNDEVISNLEEKKRFLRSDDVAEKKRIILELMTQRSDEAVPQIDSANSWFTEGVATYCETNPPGEPNEERIYGFQELMKSGQFLPLEQLSAYKMGSFPGVYQQAMLYAYSQSWAVVKYLMDNHHDGFLRYLVRVAETPPEGNQDIEWLEEAVGLHRREIEKNVKEYMTQFDEVDDPVFKVIEKNQEFQEDIETFLRFGKTNV